MALNGFLGQLVFELSDKAAEGNELISKPGKIGDEENDVESWRRKWQNTFPC